MKINAYEYKDLKIAEISEDLHAELMKYWDEEYEFEFNSNIKLPVNGIYNYLCWFEKNKSWDAIHAMENKDGSIKLFGEEFRNKEYALRWFRNEYYDTYDLLWQDKRNNPQLDELERLRSLVNACADHIISFEENQAKNVLENLGFYRCEINEYIDNAYEGDDWTDY